MSFDIHKAMFETQKKYNHTFIVRLKSINADIHFKDIGGGNIKQMILKINFHFESGKYYSIEMEKVISVIRDGVATDYGFYANDEIVSHCINILMQNTNLMEA